MQEYTERSEQSKIRLVIYMDVFVMKDISKINGERKMYSKIMLYKLF